MDFLGMTCESDASTRNERQINKSFLVFFKKNKKKYFFLKKEAKTFVNCSLFAAVGWSGRWRFSNAIALGPGAEPLAFSLRRPQPISLQASQDKVGAMNDIAAPRRLRFCRRRAEMAARLAAGPLFRGK
ncbi:MAG: hypothetical protein WDN04_27260 [Rhodospirillales bacterium]